MATTQSMNGSQPPEFSFNKFFEATKDLPLPHEKPLPDNPSLQRKRADEVSALPAEKPLWQRPARAMTLACDFVRPFSYYDGVLFEVRSARLPADAPVAAGGRYDGLAARLGGVAAAAVGVMVRPGRAWRDAPLPADVRGVVS